MKNINTNKKSESFLARVLSIAIPVSLQALIASSLGMIDQIMIGQLGETSVAAVSLGGRPGFVMVFALGGICAAISIFASQAEGSKDYSRHSEIMKAGLLGCLVCSVPFFVLSLFFPEIALRFFTKDLSVIKTGSVYLKIVAPSYFAQVIVLCAAAMLRSTGDSKTPLVTGFISVAANTALNAVLIFGLLGFPKMAERGAAIATVISRFIEALILIAFMVAKKHPASLEKAFCAKLQKPFVKTFFLTALPAIGNELLWAIGDATYSSIYGHLGTLSLAAMALTFPVQGLSMGFLSGLASSAAIITGNSLGGGDFEKAYKGSWKIIKYSLIACAFIAVFICALSGVYTNLYNVEQNVRSLGQQLIFIFCAYFPVKVLNMVIGSGIIRSGGETKYTLFLDVLGTYGIGLPLGLLSALVFHFPVQAVYALLSVEEVVRLVLGLRRVKSKKWMKKIEN